MAQCNQMLTSDEPDLLSSCYSQGKVPVSFLFVVPPACYSRWTVFFPPSDLCYDRRNAETLFSLAYRRTQTLIEMGSI